MKRTMKTLTIAAAVLVLAQVNIRAEKTVELTVADIDLLTEAVVEEDVSLEAWMIETSVSEVAIKFEEWMIEAPASERELQLEEWMIKAPVREKAIELEDWMLQPFKFQNNEAAITLEDWMFRFS